MELLKEQHSASPSLVPDVYAIVPSVAVLPRAVATVEQLRQHGVRVQMHAAPSLDGMGSMKSQFKKADASGAMHALVFGDDELSRGMVTVKALRDGEGEQIEHPCTSSPHQQPPSSKANL